MKTLFVVNFPPYPAISGSPLRVWQHINVFATQGPVYVFSAGGEREPGLETMPGVAGWTHFNDSDFSKSNGIVAKLARTLLPRQYLIPDTFAQFTINRALRRRIAEIQPDLIVLSHWKNACPAPLRKQKNVVLDMHNIESLLGTGVRTVVKSTLLRNLILWRWRRRERDLVRRASRVWVCGPNDIAALKEVDPQVEAPLVWPNAIDLRRYEAVRDRRIAIPDQLTPRTPTIGYIGLYSYEPNLIAAMELIENVFPLIRERMPEARLLLIGDRASQGMRDAALRDPRIIVTGRVDDLDRYLAAIDVCVVPLKTGGGTRMKILECFAAKIPVVSTSKGAEGIEAAAGLEIRIADSARVLADNALELMNDSQARQRQVDAAYDLVAKLYSWDALAERVNEAVPVLAHTGG